MTDCAFCTTHTNHLLGEIGRVGERERGRERGRESETERESISNNIHNQRLNTLKRVARS